MAKARHRHHQHRLIPKWKSLKKFGYVITMDHFDCKDMSATSKHGHRFGVIGFDIRTGVLMNRPLTTKTGVETSHEFPMWRDTQRITHCHSDGSGELGWVCKYEGISHDVTEPGDAQSNGIAEGMVQITKMGATAALCQAGLPHPILASGPLAP